MRTFRAGGRFRLSPVRHNEKRNKKKAQGLKPRSSLGLNGPTSRALIQNIKAVTPEKSRISAELDPPGTALTPTLSPNVIKAQKGGDRSCFKKKTFPLALPNYDTLQVTGEFPGHSCQDSDREVI